MCNAKREGERDKRGLRVVALKVKEGRKTTNAKKSWEKKSRGEERVANKRLDRMAALPLPLLLLPADNQFRTPSSRGFPNLHAPLVILNSSFLLSLPRSFSFAKTSVLSYEREDGGRRWRRLDAPNNQPGCGGAVSVPDSPPCWLLEFARWSLFMCYRRRRFKTRNQLPTFQNSEQWKHLTFF